MKQNNGRLVALVASVAVAAVAIGGVLAYRQDPQQADTAAAPLPAQSSTPKATTTPPKTPTPVTPTPTRTPTPTGPSSPVDPTSAPTSTGPTTVTIDAAKLSKGREPQLPYVIGREVHGGAGRVQKIPGTEGIYGVGRLDNSVLAVVAKGEGTELLKLDGETVDRTPGVSSLVTTRDQSAAAYAVARISSLGTATKGGVVYSDTGGSVRSLKVPNGWNVQVLAYAAGKVYYRSGDTEGGSWKLYEWTPGAATAEAKKVVSPTAVSLDGRIAASAGLINDSGSCSTISEIATGKQLWRTCQNMVSGFTPDGATAIGGSAYGDGYCETAHSALDAKSGRLVREWKGCFHSITAEDDQHLLLVTVVKNAGEENATRSIVRCDISTGVCELATAPRTGTLVLGS